MTAQYFYVVVAEPRGNYPGRIEEGWFIFDGSKVVLTNMNGAPMIGDYRATPNPSEPHVDVARRMLKAKLASERRDRGIGGPPITPPPHGGY